jgi:hypothetical protein
MCDNTSWREIHFVQGSMRECDRMTMNEERARHSHRRGIGIDPIDSIKYHPSWLYATIVILFYARVHHMRTPAVRSAHCDGGVGVRARRCMCATPAGHCCTHGMCPYSCLYIASSALMSLMARAVSTSTARRECTTTPYEPRRGGDTQREGHRK